MQMRPLFTVQQIREIEDKAIKQQFNGNDFLLMQKAGLAAFNKILELYSNIKNFIVFCGQGNNGGDGFIIAKLAADHGFNVTVVFLGSQDKLTNASAKAYSEYKQFVNNQNIQLTHYENFQALPLVANNNSIYVDALFGIGLNKEPNGQYKQAIEYLNNCASQNKAQVFSVDIPSGLQADTGLASGSTIKATATLTFVGLKQGLLTADGPDHCGKLFVDSLNIDENIFQQADHASELINADWARSYIKENLPARAKNSHKHQFGHVVIIGGDKNMPGAVLMAAQAALRVGAGLATIITHHEHGREITYAQPEIMIYGVDDNPESHKQQIFDLLNKATVIIIGPGLGQTSWSQAVFNRWLNFMQNKPTVPTVIDADGLNLLSEVVSDNLKHANLVLTPHPGEAKKLLHSKIDIGRDRFAAVKLISEIYHATTVLKGVGSLIWNSSNKIGLSAVGNPGLASAGTGDILSGLIGGLLAQKLDNYHAVCLAVYLHGAAADLQAQAYGERGLLATDLLLEIRKLLNNP